ncbi:hypothetical protein [Bryobacter aggregatus]|uniref:hypothetical protein n=1 Tax=Bryobacter aggregatus TaxID=360054 RepID=UPI0004E2329D|nr:hypothetical protein [Bryobacter aggregatus]
MSAVGLPPGLTATFAPATVASSVTTTLTVRSDAATPKASDAIRINTRSGTLTQFLDLSVTVKIN